MSGGLSSDHFSRVVKAAVVVRRGTAEASECNLTDRVGGVRLCK